MDKQLYLLGRQIFNQLVTTINNFKPVISFLVIGILIFHDTHAQFRKYSNEFLNIGAGARGLAMGGAQVASVGDATAGFWNPAGLTQVNSIPEASLMHAQYFAGISRSIYR